MLPVDCLPALPGEPIRTAPAGMDLAGAQRCALICVLLMAAVHSAIAAEDPSPAAIVQAADQAVRNTAAVLYEGETTAQGAIADAFPRVRGRVLLARGPEGSAGRSRLDIEGLTPG